MNTRFYIVNSRAVPGGGQEIIRVGLPEPRAMVNDICLCAMGSYDFVPLNSNVLREALLKDPEVTKSLLGIIVKDATIKEEKVVKEPISKPKASPTTAKEKVENE